MKEIGTTTNELVEINTTKEKIMTKIKEDTTLKIGQAAESITEEEITEVTHRYTQTK